MSSDQMVAVFSALVAFAGLLLVVAQMRVSTKQRNLESLYQVYDVNRQLLSLCFSHPQLFPILTDEKNVDPAWERRYLQMWLNQFALIHSYLKHGGFDPEFQDSLEKDIADFMTHHNMQRHWEQHGEFYPPSFQSLVNGIIKKSKPRHKGPHHS